VIFRFELMRKQHDRVDALAAAAKAAAEAVEAAAAAERGHVEAVADLAVAAERRGEEKLGALRDELKLELRSSRECVGRQTARPMASTAVALVCCLALAAAAALAAAGRQARHKRRSS
jgi:hypothetical protein